LYGIKPAIIAIFAAIYPLAKKSLKTTQLGIIAVGR
jgi:chromate transporter